jgi:hypothetical protein
MMIIAKQTAEKTASHPFVKGIFPKTVIVAGLLVAEVISVYVVDEDGAALPLYNSSCSAVTLSVTSQPMEIPSPCTLLFSKPLTENAVGVQVIEGV